MLAHHAEQLKIPSVILVHLLALAMYCKSLSYCLLFDLDIHVYVHAEKFL
jgi:hypothetical protein